MLSLSSCSALRNRTYRSLDKESVMNALRKVTQNNLDVRPNVPIKDRSNCPTAVILFSKISAEQNFVCIKESLLANKIFQTNNEVEEAIKAFLQWFTAGATFQSKSFVMLDGPVDQVFHCMILHTTWYFEFCLTYTGVYTHHDPLTVDQRKEVGKLRAATHATVNRLEQAFGNELHPLLKSWGDRLKNEVFVPESVSCVGNGAIYSIIKTE